ncbi:MAG: hypothetical protein RLZZ117_615 [Cyanobacteriota bacterium]
MRANRAVTRAITALRAKRERLRVRRHGWHARWLLRRHPELQRQPSRAALDLYNQFRGRSVNLANLLRLQHDRVMRPCELRELLLAWLASGEPNAALAALLCEALTDAPTLLRAPATYGPTVATHDLGDAQLRWYRRGDGSEAPADRLVVAFTSNANALAMIAPCFLQLLGPFATDVVLVLRQRPQRQTFYGPDGGGSLLARALQALPTLVPLADYRQVVTVGYSGGGFAAVAAAVALGADRGVSLGGPPPGGARDGLPQPWMDDLRAAVPVGRSGSPQPHLLLCCSAGCQADLDAMERAASQVSAWRYPLGGLETRAYQGCRDHNLLVELQRRRYALAPVVADLLFPADRSLHLPPPLARRARWSARLPRG